MPLRVKCAGCGQVLEAPDGLAGKRAKCQNCGAVVELPTDDPFAPPKELAAPTRQPGSSSPAQGPLPQTRVASEQRVAPVAVDRNREAKSAPRNNVLVVLGWTAASALLLVGGCIVAAFLAGLRVKDEVVEPIANDVAPAVEESTSSVGEMGVGTQIPAGQGFEFTNVTTRRDFSIFKVLGEVTNRSGRSYSTANFVITVYDKGGKLLDTARTEVSNLADGATRKFEVPIVGAWGDEIGSYKIEFKRGM